MTVKLAYQDRICMLLLNTENFVLNFCFYLFQLEKKDGERGRVILSLKLDPGNYNYSKTY